ncbi:MAG: DUF1290 domain-containing protein [Actinomycetaceae bacterium]|nr:DUF1290 domain-containing protein [Actinomycetaceae bacterium]
MFAILGLVIGIVLGLFLDLTLPIFLIPYLPVAVVAAMDALLGAARSFLDKTYSDRIFITSFLFNVTVAGCLVFLGDQLGVGSQMTTAVVVVLGIRIFSNTAAIRRKVFKA